MGTATRSRGCREARERPARPLPGRAGRVLPRGAALRAVVEAGRDPGVRPRPHAHRRRSCHGAGKTAIAARVRALVPRRLPVTRESSRRRRPSRRSATCSGGRSGSATQAADGFIGGELFDTRLELATDWFALGLSTDRADRFQGHHAEHLLLVVDEAVGSSRRDLRGGYRLPHQPRCPLAPDRQPDRDLGQVLRRLPLARGRSTTTIRIAARSTRRRSPASACRTASEQRLVSRKWVEEHSESGARARRSGRCGSRPSSRPSPTTSSSRSATSRPRRRARARARTAARPRLRRRPLRLRPDRARRAARQRRRGSPRATAAATRCRPSARSRAWLASSASEHGRKPTRRRRRRRRRRWRHRPSERAGRVQVSRYLNAARRPRDRRTTRTAAARTGSICRALPRSTSTATRISRPTCSRRATRSTRRAAASSRRRRRRRRRLRRTPDRADAVVMALSIDPPGRRHQHATMSVPTGQIRMRRFLREADDVAVPFAVARGEYAKERLVAMRHRAGVPLTTKLEPEIRS